MKNHFTTYSLSGFFLFVILMSCSKSDSLAPFKPEITNATDNFQLQATGVKSLTSTLTYNWNMTGVKANINKSGAVTAGEAWVILYDSGNTEVYRGNLKNTGTEQSIDGLTGQWKIKLELTNMSGDLNFRVQKKE